MIGYCRTPNSDLQKCPPCLALQKSVIQPHKMYTCSSLWSTCGNYFIMTWIPVYSGAQHNESENRKWLLRIYQSRFFSESNLLRTLCGGNTQICYGGDEGIPTGQYWGGMGIYRAFPGPTKLSKTTIFTELRLTAWRHGYQIQLITSCIFT